MSGSDLEMVSTKRHEKVSRDEYVYREEHQLLSVEGVGTRQRESTDNFCVKNLRSSEKYFIHEVGDVRGEI